VLGRDQLRRWVDHFGTPESQVLRDHLISHVLVHLPEITPAAIFFGGTALCRTHLPDWRLSEDVDLLVEGSDGATEALNDRLARHLRREYPGVTLRWTHEGETFVGTVAANELTIRIQLVTLDASYRLYPTGRIPVMLRYEDLPVEIAFECPTLEGAAAMKLNAWAERAAPRDLCDLYGLLRAGALTGEALRVAADASRPIQPHQFHDDRMPSEEAWQAALGHQMRELPPRDVAFASVRSVVAALGNWKG
jgi:predicted nucleotidyltransferase component of viral defense system